MTLRVSNGFKVLILGPNSFVDIFQGGRILLYSGVQPNSADDAPTGTLIAEVTLNGQPWGGMTGLSFVATGSYVGKDPGQHWKTHVLNAGTVGWFRLAGPDEVDPDDLSFTYPRIDGSVGETGAAQLLMKETTLALLDEIELKQFLYTIPPLTGA